MPDSSAVFSDILSRMNDLSKRVTALETYEYIKLYPILGASDYLINTALTNGVVYTSANLRGVGGISEQAKGFLGTIWITPLIATVSISITSSDDTPSAYSQQYKWSTTGITNSFNYSQTIFCPLGAGGAIKLLATGSNVTTFIVAHAYWM